MAVGIGRVSTERNSIFPLGLSPRRPIGHGLFDGEVVGYQREVGELSQVTWKRRVG